MSAKGRSRGTWTSVLVLLAALAWWGFQQWQGEGDGAKPGRSASSRQSETSGTSAGRTRPGNGASGGYRPDRVGGYEKFPGCTLIPHRNNDGDSFHVRLPGGREVEFRLYYVDTPESQRKHYRNGQNNLKRIGYQARYFGISPGRAVEIGHEAKERVREKLGAAPFTVFTKWEPVFESGRFFAFVQLPEGLWLHEWLVRQGLARIYTKGETMPDGTSVSRRKKQLRSLEAQAKSAGKGAWSK